jgi:3-methylfumaryl-CoA hydratase
VPASSEAGDSPEATTDAAAAPGTQYESFNTHRNHYDAPYAEQVERYRGLVVHGPLTASLLLQLAASELGANRLRSFAFRGLSPAISGEPLHLVMRKSEVGYDLAAFADDGRQVTQASASL